MIPGFIKVDIEYFYRNAWQRVNNACREAYQAQDDEDFRVVVDSNWKAVKKCMKAGIPAPDLFIYWGFKNSETGEKTILAVSRASADHSDEHWVSPALK
jgi:hypothetical protein